MAGHDQAVRPLRFNAARIAPIFDGMTDKDTKVPDRAKEKPKPRKPKVERVEEIGGYDGQEPTTFGDWQHKGRVTDF